jgi:hypothetical protein
MLKVIAGGLVALTLLLSAGADAQVAWSTGTVGFQLRNAGAIRFGAPVWSSLRHLDRTSLVAALDTGAVYDQAEDANVLEAAAFLPVPGVDTVATNVSDNSFSGAPPKIRVRTTVYAWRNEQYVLFRYTVINDTTVTLPLYLGTAVIPRPNNTYGLETVHYDAARQVAYFFRTGEPYYVGLKYLDGAPSSFHALDWNVYSPDPASDLATDATRYAMTAPDGFDGPLTGSPDGTIYNLNAGLRTLAPGDSATISYALVYAADAATLLNEADSAQARFNGVFTSVTPAPELPGDVYRLDQNYPNPFNPVTRIPFVVPAAGRTTIVVHDLLGREVARPVDAVLAPGVYTAEFSGAGLPSGVYLYTLTSGTAQATRRMVLLR